MSQGDSSSGKAPLPTDKAPHSRAERTYQPSGLLTAGPTGLSSPCTGTPSPHSPPPPAPPQLTQSPLSSIARLCRSPHPRATAHAVPWPKILLPQLLQTARGCAQEGGPDSLAQSRLLCSFSAPAPSAAFTPCSGTAAALRSPGSSAPHHITSS